VGWEKRQKNGVGKREISPSLPVRSTKEINKKKKQQTLPVFSTI
jgi:hypothetical protein